MADNSITVSGNVTREPELKFLNSGQATIRMGVAVNRRWQNRATGEWEERTSFFDVSAYGPLAENCAQTLQKGTRVIVTGRLEQRSWETPDGDKRSAVEINADEIGTSLRYATASVTKTPRPEGAGPAPRSQSAGSPSASPSTPSYGYDEEPF
jgi:single-strand DNA-binding protein